MRQDSMALKLSNLRKRYGDNAVLRGINMCVAPGEIRGLLGANGAGKSTLIACLSGAQRQDAGSIEIGGLAYHDGFTPREAFKAGIGVIYQHLSVIGPLSIARNVFLGDEYVRSGIVDIRRQEEEAHELLSQLGADIDPRTPVQELAMGERQLVEIAKMIRKEPKVLILDEPTAALSSAESQRLSERLRELRDRQRIGIIYVSHLMNEVFDLVDSVTVLRDGLVSIDSSIEKTSPEAVIHAIAPDMQDGQRRRSKSEVEKDSLLDVKNLKVGFVDEVSFEVRKGESVAIFGLLGSGRTETVEAVLGLQKPESGELSFAGEKLKGKSNQAVKMGIGFVPSDRKQRGIFPGLTTQANMLLPHIGSFSRFGIRQYSQERATYTRIADRVTAYPKDAHMMIEKMSGGNQQKILLGRWLASKRPVQIMVLDEPTQGIDIGARGDIYRLLLEQVEAGVSVLFTSSDPDEVLQLADRVYVLNRGKLVDTRSASDHDVASLLACAHGVESHDDRSENTAINEESGQE